MPVKSGQISPDDELKRLPCRVLSGDLTRGTLNPRAD